MSALTLGERKALRSYSENMTWFRGHYTDLIGKYADKFVAINNDKPIDSDTDPRRLIGRLQDKYGEKTATFAIEFVSKNAVELIM